jgi:hypothetical protein
MLAEIGIGYAEAAHHNLFLQHDPCHISCHISGSLMVHILVP